MEDDCVAGLYLHEGACHGHLQDDAHLLQETGRGAGHLHVEVQVAADLDHLLPRCVHCSVGRHLLVTVPQYHQEQRQAAMLL